MKSIELIADSAIGTFVALMAVEVLVKPIAIKVGRFLVRKADQSFPAIPDWLHKGPIE
jgi:hypothetical protein